MIHPLPWRTEKDSTFIYDAEGGIVVYVPDDDIRKMIVDAVNASRR